MGTASVLPVFYYSPVYSFKQGFGFGWVSTLSGSDLRVKKPDPYLDPKSQYNSYFKVVFSLLSINTARKVQFRRILNSDGQTACGSDKGLKPES